jgi:hypothetical protein
LDSNADVGWHWDRDYVLEDSGVNIHPMLSTVTYLSDAAHHGLCTVAFDALSPPQRDGVRPVSLPASGTTVNCTIVPPRLGRHFLFDGRYLHGAPQWNGREIPNQADDGAKRVTFLANIWVGHKPANASPVPEEMQEWTSPDRSAAIISAAPALASSSPAEVTGIAAQTFPLEGGAFKVVLPGMTSDDGGKVITARVAASWSK